MKKVRRFFHPGLLSPLVILIVFLIYSNIESTKENSLNVELDTTFFTLDPTKADDWSSFFVINHIYPRLYDEGGNFRSRSILQQKHLSCASQNVPVSSPHCTRVKIQANLSSSLHGCNGKIYSIKDFQHELQTIARAKNWLLRNFEFCESNSHEACFEFNKTTNVDSLMRSIYFRFGWSLSAPNDNIFGIMPFCFQFQDVHKKTGRMDLGQLKINIAPTFKNPDINLYANSTSNEMFTKDFFNPITYFLVINGRFLHKFSSDTVSTIASQFRKPGLRS